MQDDFNLIEEQPELLPEKKNKKRAYVFALCAVLVAILAVVSAILVKQYVISTFIVDGVSMYPTLDGGNGAQIEGNSKEERLNGEVLYLNRIAKIKRGDIVVFSAPGNSLVDESGNPQTLVKRVIAVGGDHLKIHNNKVYLNGELLDEPYINGDMHTPDLEVTIRDGYIFCMGDNRNNSSDSRMFGQVPLDNVVGKCFAIKGIDGKIRWM